MVADYAFCPRFAHYRWVSGIDCDFDTDRASSKPRESPLRLSWDGVGIAAIIHEMEHDNGECFPIVRETQAWAGVEGCRSPGEVALCVQAMVLQANSYLCQSGVIECEDSDSRRVVSVDESLLTYTWETINLTRSAVESSEIPAPLSHDRRCESCPLSDTCMPDETAFLNSDPGETPADNADVRRFVPARDDSLPLHVQVQGAYVSRQDETLEIRVNDKLITRTRMMDISQVCVYGNVQVTTQALRGLFRRGIPLCYFSSSGWFYGITQSTMGKDVRLRMAQYRVAQDQDEALKAARQFIWGKIRNCRTMLRRNSNEIAVQDLNALTLHAEKALDADNLLSLMGIEGAAASVYFSNFASMIKGGMGFDFQSRNRRPPKDPVNAVLSYLYSMLVKDLTVACMAAGLDPYAGLCHQPGHGRPSLALDLMEEFRPLICDSVCIRLINTGELRPDEFTSDGGGVLMADSARKKVIAAYEARMDTLVRHPIFEYTLNYRRVLAVQTGLLVRWLCGEIPSYPPFCTR